MLTRTGYTLLVISAGLLLGCTSRSGPTPHTEAPDRSTPALQPASGTNSKPTCPERFAMLDTDGDGRLSMGELFRLPHPCPDPEELFESRDVNRDGFLTEDEFCSEARLGARSGKSKNGDLRMRRSDGCRRSPDT
jgi:hypothetical protein